jgi:Tfp pilus assembly protein PilO
MEWSKLKPRERSALIILGLAVLFGLYMRFVEGPASRKIAGYKSQIRNSQMQLKDLETKLPQDEQISSKLLELEAKEKQLSREVAEFEERMPSQFNTSELVAQLTSLAKEVKLESVKQRIVREQAYSRIFLEVKFYATTLDAVRYVAAVESLSPFLRVEEFELLEAAGKTVELGGAPVNLTVSCLLGDSSAETVLKPSQVPELSLKRDMLGSSSKPVGEMSDAKFALEGITYDLRNPTAIVNGDVYQTGSKLGPYTVKTILADSVVLSDGVNDHVLSLKPAEVGKT